MSDLMLLGVLRLPRECWSNDPIFVMQQHARCLEAADRIESDAEALAQSESRRKELAEALEALTAACEKEFTSQQTESGEIHCEDADSVMGGLDGDSPITFGMIRLARLVLSKEPK